jgi:hypothetical protein
LNTQKRREADERALRAIERAADALSSFDNEPTDWRRLRASHLLMQLSKALHYGDTYPVEPFAKSFDQEIQCEIAGPIPIKTTPT